MSQNNNIEGWDSIVNGLSAADLATQSSKPCKCQKMSTCPCIKRITYILSFYQQWLENPQSVYNKGMKAFIDSLSNYDGIGLLNDYHHIMDYHCKNCKTYEKVYKFMISKLGKINIEKSICIKRNYRNRNNLSKNNKEEIIKLYFGFDNISEINIQQILDTIYSYLLHSFDLIRLSPENEKSMKQTVGNILKEDKEEYNKHSSNASKHLDLSIDDTKIDKNHNKKPENKINLKFLKPSKEIMDKREIHCKIIGKHYMQKNKFLTCVNYKNIDNNNNDEKKKENDNDSLSVEPELNKRSSARVIQESDNQMAYTFGKKWYYWDIYKKNHYTKRDYVAKKYNTLKEEICKYLSIYQYHILYERASLIVATNKGSRIIAPLFEDWEDQHEFGIKQGMKISIDHILALLLFMNYNDLKNELVSTFTKIEDENHKKESDRKFKLRHENFVNWSMKLTEAVLVFGQRMDSFDVFYHCMDIQMIFSKNKLLFFGPTSVTSKLEIAQQFQYQDMNGLKGLILVLADWYSDYEGSRFFNSSWFSDFPYQYENIFIGADSPIKIASVIKTIQTK